MFRTSFSHAPNSAITSLVIALVLTITTSARAQMSGGETVKREKFKGAVDNVYVIPYITGSYNLQSGQAFPKSASGIGFGAGIAFDLTTDGQKTGLYFDLAFQDMRAKAEDGFCVNMGGNDSLLRPARAEHYFQYALFEGFLKLQGAKSNGYFLIGGSIGYATTSTTRAVASNGKEQFAYWDGTDFGRGFRFDIRAGLGLLLGSISNHKVVLEARVGYPVTVAVADYQSVCSGNGQRGDWRVVSLQTNLGLRF